MELTPLKYPFDSVHLIQSGTNPGAGTPYTGPTYTDAVVELIALDFTFTTDATVITRIVNVVLTNSPSGSFAFPAPADHTAGQAIRYSCFHGANIVTGGPAANRQSIAIPARLPLWQNSTFQIIPTNIQAGDVISAISFFIRLYPLPT